MFLNSSSQDIKGSIEHKTSTAGNVQTNTIIWTIPNFMNILNNKSVSEIRAPKPTATPSVASKFYFMMQFLGEDRSLVEIYYLSPTPQLLKLVIMKLTTSPRDLRINPYGANAVIDSVTVTTKECQFVQANKWQYLTDLMKLNASDTSVKKITTLANGNLTLTFEFLVTIKIDGFASFLTSATQTPETQLSKDLEILFNDSMYSDIVMKSVDDEEFKAHKVLLASRSPVLKAHFQHDFTESTTNIVESPLESAVLHEVLSFIYTDKALKVDEFPEKLLAAADYYQLSRMKSLCEDALHKKLTVDNAIETLKLADLHSAKTLKQQTLEFIKYAPLTAVIKTEGWNKLQSVDLIKEICAYCN